MKSLFAACTLVFLAAACAPQQGSTVANDETPAEQGRERIAFAVTGSIGEVRAAAAQNGASGMWTDVELKYSLPCNEKVESFSYALRNSADGKTQILASMIFSKDAHPAGFSCQSIRLLPKKITVPGILSHESVSLVNLTGAEATLPATTRSLAPIGMTMTGAVAENGGTKVTLKSVTGMSCVEKVAPVLFAVEQGEGGKVKLAVGAVKTVDSRLVRCLSAPKSVDIMLPGVSAAADDIELTLVGGN